MSTHPSPEQSPDCLTALPGIGPATADTLAATLDINQTDVRNLARAFFGTEGPTVAETVQDADALIHPLLQAGRDLDEDAFGVRVDTPTVLEVMAFVRLFGVNPRFLRSEYTFTGALPNQYAIPPSAIDWEQGVIADRFDVAASVYSRETAQSTHHIDPYQTDTAPEYLTQNPYQWVAYHSNGSRSLVGYEYVETVGELFDRDFFEEASFEFIRTHKERGDYFVTFTDPNWVTDVVIAPKILDDD